MIRLLARVKGWEDEFHVRMVTEGVTNQLIVTRGQSEPITIEIVAERAEGPAAPEISWEA